MDTVLTILYNESTRRNIGEFYDTLACLILRKIIDDSLDMFIKYIKDNNRSHTKINFSLVREERFCFHIILFIFI